MRVVSEGPSAVLHRDESELQAVGRHLAADLLTRRSSSRGSECAGRVKLDDAGRRREVLKYHAAEEKHWEDLVENASVPKRATAPYCFPPASGPTYSVASTTSSNHTLMRCPSGFDVYTYSQT